MHLYRDRESNCSGGIANLQQLDKAEGGWEKTDHPVHASFADGDVYRR